MTKDQISAQATQIINQINDQRRTETLTTVSRIANDDVFLKAANITRDQVAQAAQNKGISQEQVIQLLRNKYSTKARPSVRGTAPAEAPEGDVGSTNAPEPQINIPEQSEDDQ